MPTPAELRREAARATEIERAHAAIKRAQHARIERLRVLNAKSSQSLTDISIPSELELDAQNESIDVEDPLKDDDVGSTGGKCVVADVDVNTPAIRGKNTFNADGPHPEQYKNNSISNRGSSVDRVQFLPHAEYRCKLMHEARRIAAKQGIAQDCAPSWFPDKIDVDAVKDTAVDTRLCQQPLWESSTRFLQTSCRQRTPDGSPDWNRPIDCRGRSDDTGHNRSHHQRVPSLVDGKVRGSKGECIACQDIVWSSQRRYKSTGGAYYHAACIELHPELPLEIDVHQNRLSDFSFYRTQRASMTILDLPDEIMLRILSCLTHTELMACARVCQHFYRVAGDVSLWSHTDMRGVQLTPAIMASIGAKQPKHLQLAWCEGVSTSAVLRLLRACGRDLVSLDVTGVTAISDATLCHIARVCGNLQVLNLSWCHVTNEGIGQLAADTSVVTDLRELKLTCCSAVTDTAVTKLCRRFATSLRHVDFCGCFQITSYALRIMSYSLCNLRTLSVAQCHNVSSDSLGLCMHFLLSLSDIDVRGCQQISDEFFLNLGPHCFDNLERICVANCVHVSDTALKAIGQCTRLHMLDVKDCARVSDAGIMHLQHTVLGTLVTLDVSGTTVTSSSIALLTRSAAQLRRLQLNRCCSVSVDVLEALVRKRVRIDVGVAGCLQLPTRALRLLQQAHPHLTLSR